MPEAFVVHWNDEEAWEYSKRVRQEGWEVRSLYVDAVIEDLKELMRSPWSGGPPTPVITDSSSSASRGTAQEATASKMEEEGRGMKASATRPA